MLRKFDAELLIGNVSYKQKAEIYNVFNGYDLAKKERSQGKKIGRGQLGWLWGT